MTENKVKPKKEELLNAVKELEDFADQLKLCEDDFQQEHGQAILEYMSFIKQIIEENVL